MDSRLPWMWDSRGGLVFVIAGIFALRAIPIRPRFPFPPGVPGIDSGGMYKTFEEARAASKKEAHDIAERSRNSTMTVLQNQPNKDPKGSISFGIKWDQKTAFGGSSGSVSTDIAANHRYLNDYRKLKVGQEIVFEEVSGNPRPKERDTFDSLNPYQYLRPIPK